MLLPTGETCVVHFDALVLRKPAIDAQPGTPGTQTFPTTSASFYGATVSGLRNSGNSVTTVFAATPTIATQATSTASIGSPIQDVATVTGAPAPAAQPTGTLSFTAFGPNDSTCAGPASFSSGPKALAGGSPPTAASGGFIPTSTGTYRWVATYNGDANYDPITSSCNDVNETSVVTQAVASITTVATPSVTIGGSIQDVATVSGPGGAAPQPTGTVSFQLYGPGNPICVGAPIFTSTTFLSGGSPPSAVSGAFTPTSTGTYLWVAGYSGDANYPAVTSPCQSPNETSVVTPAFATVTTSATASANLGGSIQDVATVTGAPAPAPTPTGSVTFVLYGPDNAVCVGSPIFNSGPKPLGGGPPPTAISGAFTPTSAGVYRWIASYNGDANYAAVTGACNDVNEISVVTASGSGRYNPLTPARILDTRNGPGPVGPGATVDVQITGQGGVPASGVTAVAVNVTVTQPTASSFMTIFPAGSPRPLAANLNYTPNKTVANLVVVKVGAGGKVSMFNSTGSTHAIYDVAGWYSDVTGGSDGRYVPVTAARLLDTRGGVRLGPNSSLDLQVSNQGGVPATGAVAAVLNVTVTGPTATSFLTVHPTGTTRPLAANVNFTSGTTQGNRVFAKLGTGGKVTIYNNAGSTDVIVDVSGYFTDPSFGGPTGVYTPVTPARILDTRNGIGGVSGPRPANSTVEVQVTGQGGVPGSGSVTAVVLNATVISPSAMGFLTIFPPGTARPVVSDLNYASGETRPNLVVAKVDAFSGKVSLYTSASGHYVFDVAGWVGY